MTKRPGLDAENDVELNQLLARGRLSGGEYDQIERRVLGAVTEKRRRAYWPVAVPALALAAGLALFIGVRRAGRDTEFVEKGGGGPVRGVVSVGCGTAASLHCKLGDTLMFSVSGNRSSVYLVAFAERLGDTSAERIWYFPHARATAPRLDAKGGTTVLSEGIRLGPPHRAGRYHVRTWLSETPVRRDGAERLGAHGEQGVTFEITE
jgi:hypothetical protein